MISNTNVQIPLSMVRIGQRVYDHKSSTAFLVADHDLYGNGITTLVTEKIIGVRAFDGAEPNRKCSNIFEYSNKYGSNDYATSNLHQWLNSDQSEWYLPQHDWDSPPINEVLRYGKYEYLNTPGFLSEFSPEFRNALVELPIPVIKRVGRLKGELTYVNAKVFLPSRSEINKGDECGIEDGKRIQLFFAPSMYKAGSNEQDQKRYGREWNPPRIGAKYDDPQVHDPKFGWWYYLRTPNLQYSYLLRVMAPYGSLSYTYAYNDVVGVRPLLNLRSSLLVTDTGKPKAEFEVVRHQ